MRIEFEEQRKREVTRPVNLEYVLITPAHNEEAFIEKTMLSVLSQTVLPKKWVIISDGSTDRTDEIVQHLATGKEWIQLIRLPERQERHFAAKVEAFNVGYKVVTELEYDVIGSLDADVSFDQDYFEFLLMKLEQMPELGVAGTHYKEGNFHSYRDSYINVHHVNGQCQLFRRQCFEDIGGYVPIEGGGIDWVAVTSARMKGWQTYSFSEKVFIHHRPVGTANSSALRSRFHYGKKDYFLGGHPIWEVFRCVFQMTTKPYIIGGLCILWGYFWAFLVRLERPISKELMIFHRQEQIQRLKQLFLKKLRRNRS